MSPEEQESLSEVLENSWGSLRGEKKGAQKGPTGEAVYRTTGKQGSG